MTAFAWLVLGILATGVLVTMLWATIRWVTGPGANWISSVFNVRPRNDDADVPR